MPLTCKPRGARPTRRAHREYRSIDLSLALKPNARQKARFPDRSSRSARRAPELPTTLRRSDAPTRKLFFAESPRQDRSPRRRRRRSHRYTLLASRQYRAQYHSETHFLSRARSYRFVWSSLQHRKRKRAVLSGKNAFKKDKRKRTASRDASAFFLARRRKLTPRRRRHPRGLRLRSPRGRPRRGPRGRSRTRARARRRPSWWGTRARRRRRTGRRGPSRPWRCG